MTLFEGGSEQVAFVAGLYLLRFACSIRIRTPYLKERTAVRLDAIVKGLNPKVEQRAATCSVSVKRVDLKNLRWIFIVDCGNGPKVVRVKAIRDGNIVKLSKMDLEVTCSCQAWRYLGPEYAAKTESYIDGKPRGTASPPNIKDPTRVNRVCKHVAAVLSQVRAWQIPNK